MNEDELSTSFEAALGESQTVLVLIEEDLSEIERAAYDKGRVDGKRVYKGRAEILERELATAEKKAACLNIRLDQSLVRVDRTERALEEARDKLHVANQRADSVIAQCEKRLKEPRPAEQASYQHGWDDALDSMLQFLDNQ